MKFIKFILIVVCIIAVGLVSLVGCFSWLERIPMVPLDYVDTVKTGGDIEAKYIKKEVLKLHTLKKKQTTVLKNTKYIIRKNLKQPKKNIL